MRHDRMQSLRRPLLGALVSALLASHADANLLDPLSLTDRGLVRGTTTETMNVFRGIPYAAPPVGPLRWQPPQPVKPWRGVRDASQFAGHCAQPPSPFGVATTNEDCLYLNVYTPRPRFGRRLEDFVHPVMVWIHGGALFLGESDDYDPTRLVEQGIVVVTINYRLGLPGFLAHPALTAESSYGGSGDYGIQDQQAALRWVKRDILFFGGDPHNITIFGESAGGLSVNTQLASPLSAGLFDQAISESGAYALTNAPLAAAETAGTGFATAAGCPDQTLACLRALPVEALLAVQGGGGFVPNLDNHVLTQTLKASFTSGDFNRVPVIEGSNHDEWRLFVAQQELANGPLTPAQYPGAIASTLRIPLAQANALAAFVYPLVAYPSPSIALGALGTDAIFACNARTASGLLSQFAPTFAYEFNDPNAPQRFLPPVSFPSGAYHASELQYLFDLQTPVPSPGFTPDQQALAGTMVQYWTNFAKRGDPNGAEPPAWPGYTVASDQHQSLVPAGVAPITTFGADHKCSFWVPLLP